MLFLSLPFGSRRFHLGSDLLSFSFMLGLKVSQEGGSCAALNREARSTHSSINLDLRKFKGSDLIKGEVDNTILTT